MENKNWKQVETIFHTALNLGGEERVLYLSQTCSGNAALLSEVESLISAFESESGFLEEPAFSLGMNVIGRNDDKDLTGEKIGFYEIKEKLGGGGMGDVYLAEDKRLNRKVALKFLKDMFADDKWAKRQFMKEAQAVAMLEHPNICHVHSIEEIGEHNFIVMQYIEGATLAQFVSGEQPSLEIILSIAHQMISAVAAAHSHGIIHRDIKPGNIMITPEGLVKVLDFGLAKVIEQKQKAGRAEENISQISQNGLILGTVSYMSPEQLRAEKLDYRSDIFSVGIVLHEMLGKQNPFNRKSQAETIAAILSEEPPALKETELQIPETLDFIVQKCLNKDKEKRFQSAVELQIDVENVKDGTVDRSAPKKFAAIFRYAAFVIVFIAVFGAGLFLYLRSTKIPKLAVLPIANESRQADKDYLSEGLTGSLISKFSQLSGLRVIAQPIVSQYKGQEVNPQIVGKELNADVVLVGKIVQQENGLMLKISLINAADGTALLAEEYNIDDAQLINTQQTISSQIIAKLTPSLTDDEEKRIVKRQTEDPEALKMYFLGRYYWSQQHGKNMKLAVEYFKKATELDPYYAQAWSGLADSYASYSVPSIENPMSPAEAVIKARFAAKNALQIDPNLCEPYTSLGIIELKHEWNWQAAENNFKKAIELNPEYSPAHYSYSSLLTITGRFDEALAEADKAKEFDPLSPNTEMNVGRINYYKGNFELTTQIYKQLSEANPDNIRISYGLGLLYLKTGKLKEAIDILEQVYKENKSLAAAALGYAYAKADRRSDALQMLAELEQLSKEKFVSSQEKAIIYLGLDDRERAFENLNKACDERFPALPFLLIDPLFDEFRPDPRFAEIKRCANVL